MIHMKTMMEWYMYHTDAKDSSVILNRHASVNGDLSTCDEL